MILILLSLGESHFHRLNCSFFLIILCFLWIGAQLPQEIFISYGRILTLFYYKIIIYLLFAANIIMVVSIVPQPYEKLIRVAKTELSGLLLLGYPKRGKRLHGKKCN